MLILAGVSLNAVIGENGILTQAISASVVTKFASYYEEFEMNKLSAMIKQGIDEDFCVNYKGTDEEFLDYVPSIAEEDKEEFEIIAGYLVYVGDNDTEKSAAASVGIKDEYDSELWDALGKEFAYYVDSWENAKENTLTDTQLAYFQGKDNVKMSEFIEYANIPSGKYAGEFEMSYGYLCYLGTDETRLLLLATSSTLRSYIANGTLILSNYVAPEEGELSYDSSTGTYTINNWIIKILSTEGSINYAAIVGYTGTSNIVTIPDTINGTSGNSTTLFYITTVKGDGTNNIFNTDGSSGVSLDKVIVAKGITTVIDAGLANLGSNVQCHILHVGSDLCLGNDKNSSNLLGYEGIENTCGSFTFVAPSSGSYTFKLWGASGGDGFTSYSSTKGSQGGLGGYSQGTVTLEANEQIYVYIGGKGVYGSTALEDGSGGYNGGGSGLKNSTAVGYGGGGSTDIRFGGTTVSDEIDYRILIAGGRRWL